jgi:hypothetical protein
VVEADTELRLNLDQFSPNERTVVVPEIQNNPESRVAEWTGLGLRKALRWRADGKTYSATGLVKHILVLNACDFHPFPGRGTGRFRMVEHCPMWRAHLTKTWQTKKPKGYRSQSGRGGYSQRTKGCTHNTDACQVVGSLSAAILSHRWRNESEGLRYCTNCAPRDPGVSTERLRAAFDGMAVRIILKGAEGETLESNPALTEEHLTPKVLAG